VPFLGLASQVQDSTQTKKANHISSKKSSDQEAAEEHINTSEKILQLQHIYNVHKTGLLGHCLPNKSIADSHEKVAGGSKLNEV
jgi:hypothetical protein